jgi:hypothetical protein
MKMFALPLAINGLSRDVNRGVVTEKIAVMSCGRVRVNGYSWRAQLCERACQTALLPGQPVVVIHRQQITLTVLPLQSVLWDILLQQSWSVLDRNTLEILRQYDGVW